MFNRDSIVASLFPPFDSIKDFITSKSNDGNISLIAFKSCSPNN